MHNFKLYWQAYQQDKQTRIDADEPDISYYEYLKRRWEKAHEALRNIKSTKLSF